MYKQAPDDTSFYALYDIIATQQNKYISQTL